MLLAGSWWHGEGMACRLGIARWMKDETKAEAGECLHTEVLKEQLDEGMVEGQVRTPYEEVES